MNDLSESRSNASRRIYFYDTKYLASAFNYSQFRIADVVRQLRTLDRDTRYRQQTGEFDLGVLQEVQDDRLRFVKVRHEVVHIIDQRSGIVRTLRLDLDEGLFQCIHIIFFEGGIVGSDFNLYGPRLAQLSEYLLATVTGCPPLLFTQKVGGDVMAQLQRAKEIRLIDIRIDPSRTEAYAPLTGGWLNGKSYLAANLGVGSLEVTIKVGNRSRRALHPDALDALKQIVGQTNYREGTDKLRARAVMSGETATELIDLLDDRLVTTVSFHRSLLRNPDAYAEWMYGQIETAYHTLLPHLRSASSVGVEPAAD